MSYYYVYIATNKSNTLYIDVTNNIQRRLWEHNNKLIEGFTERYKVDRLIYYEEYSNIKDAIAREKQLKNWSRTKKMWLIKMKNPNFKNLL